MSTINGMKLMKDTCSFTNALMANPRYTEPKIGMDVTELMWSDRAAYRIVEVSKDGRTFVMRRYASKWIGEYYGDERYRYVDENGNPLLSEHYTKTIKFRYGRWYEQDKYLNSKGKPTYSKINLAFNCREDYRDPSF